MGGTMKNLKVKSIFIICLFIIFCDAFLFRIPAYSESTSKQKILIINSSTKSNTLDSFNNNNWNDEIVYGLESKLKENKLDIDLKVEYMDSNFNTSDEYYVMLYNLYKYKYNKEDFDAVITLSDNAADLMVKYANDLFPNTPIIFSAVDPSKKSTLVNQPLFTGLYKSQDLKDTIDGALTLHPKAKHFFVITTQELDESKMLQDVVSLYGNKVDFTFCTDKDINEVKKSIKTLSDDTIIFIGLQFYNSFGEPFSVPEITNILFSDCPLPVYATGYSYLNNGVVGGMITSGTKLGESIGIMTTRILNGEKPSDIPAMIDNSHNYVFDYNQLTRFNISLLSLPKNSEIINEPSPTYSISRKVIVGFFIGFISILIAIIIFLLTTIYKLNNTKKLLSNSESLLKTIIDSTPDIICFKNPYGEIIEANNSILDLLGTKKNEYKLKTFDQLSDLLTLPKEELKVCIYYDNECWKHGNVYRTEEILTSAKDNIRKTYDIIRIPLFYEDGSRRGLVLIGRDITEHKANEQNKKIIAELKYYDKLKMEFFTNLSHELRTPLNVVFSAIQVLESTFIHNNNNFDQNKINKYTNIMRQNCYRLIRLMNNFLDISKIDSKNYSLELQNADIINLVENIVLSIADYIENKSLSIIFDTEIEEKIIACDPNAIERIMLNLLSNAVKFTPSGGSIYVNIYCQNSDIIISVKDTGIGIPFKKQEAIFERFVQVDKSLSRNKEGSGIGLSLVKSLVELQQGTITLISSPDNGSEFIIKFPSKTLTYTNIPVNHYDLNKNRAEIIQMEFSDIYA
jgi:PAS domain S-box-containing protein